MNRVGPSPPAGEQAALRPRSTPRTAPGFTMPAPGMSGNSDMPEKGRGQGNAARRARSLACVFRAISWQQVRNPTLGIASRTARRDERGAGEQEGLRGTGQEQAPGLGSIWGVGGTASPGSPFASLGVCSGYPQFLCCTQAAAFCFSLEPRVFRVPKQILPPLHSLMTAQ